MSIAIRDAGEQDAAAIASIYNQGIEDRGATFETEPRSAEEIARKLAERERYPLLVVTEGDVVSGWAGLSSYRPRGCYGGIAEFSIYLDRSARGRGLGRQLLTALIDGARDRAGTGSWSRGSFHRMQEVVRSVGRAASVRWACTKSTVDWTASGVTS